MVAKYVINTTYLWESLSLVSTSVVHWVDPLFPVKNPSQSALAKVAGTKRKMLRRAGETNCLLEKSQLDNPKFQAVNESG
jgi:hypothetical protein